MIVMTAKVSKNKGNIALPGGSPQVGQKAGMRQL
jgi:hypothetical protein